MDSRNASTTQTDQRVNNASRIECVVRSRPAARDESDGTAVADCVIYSKHDGLYSCAVR